MRLELDIQKFADGEIVIGTRVDNSGLKDGLKETEKIAKDFDENTEIEPTVKYGIDTKELDKKLKDIDKRIEDKEIIIHYDDETPKTGIVGAETFYETDLVDTEKLIQKENEERRKQVAIIEQANQALQETSQKQSEIKNEVSSTNYSEVFEFDEAVGYTEQIALLERKLNDMIADYNMMASEENFNAQSQDALELASNIEIATNKLNAYKKKQQEVEGTGFKGIIKQIDTAGSKITREIKKVGRWALALLGVRTAISLVTRAFGTLSQYNTDLANKLEDIRLVLAVGFEGAINKIISLVITLLNYINYLSMAWFGLDLFGKAAEYKSKKIADNMGSAAGSAKEMKKQLAGFDEMNVLSDTDASGGGGGAGGSKMSEFDLPREDVPEWLKWIADHGTELLAILAGIVTFLGLIKLGVGFIQALGIGILVTGIIMTIKALLDYLKNPTWENFGKLLEGIGVIIIGLGVLFLGLPGIIVGVIVLIVGILVRYWDKIKGWIQGIADWFHNKAEEFKKKGQGFVGGIFEFISTEIEEFIKFFELVINSVKKIFDGIIKFIKGVFSGDWKMAWEGIKEIFGGIFDLIVGIAKQTLERIQNFIKTIGTAIANVISSIVNWIKDKFNIVINFFKGVGIAIGDFFSSAIKGAVNGVLSWVESKVNWFIDKINSVIKLINKIPGVNLSKISKISLPRLATGGIINQPGRGVPIGGAIGGEAGREGILPLTDARAMEMLGREIGKWITINADIPVNIGNRQIARVVRELMANDDFAMNR